MEFDELSGKVIECALEVHKYLGPGLLESTYEQCPAYEMKLTGMFFKMQHPTSCGIQRDQTRLWVPDRSFC